MHPVWRKTFNVTWISLALLTACGAPDETVPRKPNILIIYADDLGYGDVGAYGAAAGLTPNIDRLANEGLLFTDGHSSAATCTPSRYSLLTGSHAFRRDAAVLPGDAPLLIPTTTRTVAGLLQSAGYTTGIVGKWHLGLGDGDVNWNVAIAPGPIEVGFDYSFIIPATGDRVPSVYVENHHVVGLDESDPIQVSYDARIGTDPTGTSNPEQLTQTADSQHSDTIVDGISRIGFMTGGTNARWKDREFPDVLTAKARQFIEENKDDPFFLLFSFHDIHVPRVPNERFVGTTNMGPRGDTISQMDWVTGRLIQILEEHDLDEHTLVIFTSDNGPVLDDGYGDEAVERLGNHEPAGSFRGGKYSAYEAGTRVPTIVHWPTHVEPGTSDALVSQLDLFASIAALTDTPLGPEDAPDSLEMLDTWLGRSSEGRPFLIEESYTLALRVGEWKYIRPASEVGYEWIREDKDLESGLVESDQLFELTQDPSERHNVEAQEQATVQKLEAQLDRMVASPATRDGFHE